MQLQVGVKVYLRGTEGKFLLLHRSAVKYPDVIDRWDIVGGRIDPGTPLLANLERELAEETGMRMSTAPRLVAAQDILRNNDRHVVRLTYIADTIETMPTLNDEHDNFGWFSLLEMQGMADFDAYAKAVLPLVK